jgi:hypothetical protein
MGQGRTVFFVGNMFEFFWHVMAQDTVDGHTYTPYSYTYLSSVKAESQILENALTWFFTPDLDPLYTIQEPYDDRQNRHRRGLTYREEVDLGNLSPYLWREKGLRHLGVVHFLENSVWGDADDGIRLAPGFDQPDRLGRPGQVGDWNYEAPIQAGEHWLPPDQWPRDRAFLRGQLDWVKALDTHSWGALYWLLRGNVANARACLDFAERTMRVTVNYGAVRHTAFEYWDMPMNDPEFGDALWLEGTGQMAYAYGLLGRENQRREYLTEIEEMAHDFGEGGPRGVPYSWPRNNLIDQRAMPIYREDALSIAATTWTYIAQNQVPFLPLPAVPAAR